MAVFVTKQAKLDAAIQRIGYTFSHPDLLWEALQMPGASATFGNGQMSFEGHKPLASVGDAALTLAVKINCYESNSTVGMYMTLLQAVRY